jgi:hypothetical protein
MTAVPSSPNPPLWSILIATLASRRDLLARLLAGLLPQCEDDGRVEVIGCYDNGQATLAVKRQALLAAAAGDYVSCVDDDDEVEPCFVEIITRAMTLSGYLPAGGMAYGPVPPPDYVAFSHAYHVDGAFHSTVVTGLTAGRPRDEGGTIYRPVTHINPVRRALTAGATFGTGTGPGEDRAWVEQIWPRLATEVVTGMMLYHYQYRSHDSVQRALAPHDGRPRLDVDSPCFRWITLQEGL